jgi:hypothetical protein
MSGRALHEREGVLITNRKTDRRQAPKRPLIERLDALNIKYAARYPTRWRPEVRMGFLLPKLWAPFVSSGSHGIGVNVIRGFVQITNGSAGECFQSAIDFCAVVGKGRAPEIILATIRSSSEPDKHHGRWMSVVNGALVECSGHVQPRIYLPRGK